MNLAKMPSWFRQSPTTLLQSQPASICLVRLSALGDVTHMLPVVNRLRHVWPNTRLTWIIGKIEHKMVHDLPGVEFVIFDKKSGWQGLRMLRRQLGNRRFDVLLHMQASLRANLVSTTIRAPLRIGYDHARSRDLQRLFVNRRIPARTGEHVVDAFQSFVDVLGAPAKDLDWTLPISDEDRHWAKQTLNDQPSFLISPCSSHPLRNWSADRYAEIADYVARSYGLQIVLCGGPGTIEQAMGNEIQQAAKTPVLNLIGRDTIKRMLGLLSEAKALLSPDSGPAHMATCTATPVVGLHAASNPKRSGPYLSQQWCVDAYGVAAENFLKLPAEQIAWGTKIEKPGVMDLISTAAVRAQIDALANVRGWLKHSTTAKICDHH